MMWIASKMAMVCCIFTALPCHSTRACNVDCLHFPCPFNNIQLYCVFISYAAEALPGIILLYGSLVYKNIYLGANPVDEVISTLLFPNLLCNDLFVLASSHTDVRSHKPCFPALQPEALGLVSQVLTEGLVGGCSWLR